MWCDKNLIFLIPDFMTQCYLSSFNYAFQIYFYFRAWSQNNFKSYLKAPLYYRPSCVPFPLLSTSMPFTWLLIMNCCQLPSRYQWASCANVPHRSPCPTCSSAQIRITHSQVLSNRMQMFLLPRQEEERFIPRLFCPLQVKVRIATIQGCALCSEWKNTFGIKIDKWPVMCFCVCFSLLAR